MKVKCSKCKKNINIEKVLGQGTNFAFIYLDTDGKKMYGKTCNYCARLRQRTNRKESDDIYTKMYEKTITGFLVRMYRNMKSRILGVQKLKHHLYIGKYLLPKEEFYKWANASSEFHRLYDIWKAAEYPRKLTPSVDRVDSSKGYEIENMEWVTHSENSRRGSVSQRRKKT